MESDIQTSKTSLSSSIEELEAETGYELIDEAEGEGDGEVALPTRSVPPLEAEVVTPLPKIRIANTREELLMELVAYTLDPVANPLGTGMGAGASASGTMVGSASGAGTMVGSSSSLAARALELSVGTINDFIAVLTAPGPQPLKQVENDDDLYVNKYKFEPR
jgi:hypothetical protein